MHRQKVRLKGNCKVFFKILIILLLAYLLWPLIKGLLYVRDVQRNVREAFGQASRGSGNRGRQQESSPGRRGKKIDKDVGEYVEFEDITESSSSGYSDTIKDVDVKQHNFCSESQISDAEWEDIPSGK